MNKTYIIVIIILLLSVLLVACSGTEETSQGILGENQVESSVLDEEQDTDDIVDIHNTDDLDTDDVDTDDSKEFSVLHNSDSDKDTDNDSLDNIPDNVHNDIISEDPIDIYFSPFTGQVVDELYLRKALMVIVENSPAARPQSGLKEASIVYEVMAEGGITRFLAIYWDEIPDKIGPIRSARPYMIEIAEEYNALLLHAGASPDGFDILARSQLAHIDQIYNGQYYWRSNDRRAPHNLYTGSRRVEDYLDKLLGQEYQDRFDFQQVSLVSPGDNLSDYIKLPLWGGTTVIYKYDSKENQYYRYYGFLELPHLLDNNKQISVNNLVIQYAKTSQIDDIGRLEVDLINGGKALVFRDGIVIEGYWEKDINNITKFYNKQGENIKFNPGQTWIEVIPDTIKVEYK